MQRPPSSACQGRNEYWVEDAGRIVAFRARVSDDVSKQISGGEIANALVQFCEGTLHPGKPCYMQAFYSHPCSWCSGNPPRTYSLYIWRGTNPKRFRVKYSGGDHVEVLLSGQRSASSRPVVVINVPEGVLLQRAAEPVETGE